MRRRIPVRSTSSLLRYVGLYIRRLPISQKRILKVTEEEVVYQSKDTRTKTLLEARCTPAEFVATLSPHVQDRYQHSMRYFGLLAPGTKGLTSAAVFAPLGQRTRVFHRAENIVPVLHNHPGYVANPLGVAPQLVVGF
jgi:hypothetical protein